MDLTLILLLLAGIVAFFVFLYFVPVNLWITAIFSGVKIGLLELVFMRIRKVPPSIVVNSLITATKAGIIITDETGGNNVKRSLKASDLETHYLAGGNVPQVIKALISADKANINLTFRQATAIDLAGRDVFEAVQISVNPKVINTPSVAAVAADGIQLIAKARVTIRANIQQLVGGAGEDTILARVGEGIVTSVGSAASHKEVLENPDKISKLVLQRGLDAGTAFEILSIDIADVDVGANIGAKLQTDQASADLKVAEAKAEERRAMAVAEEQEMVAKAQEARAKVILAEADIPKAIADAFRSGNLGIMDYYKLENIQSDTSMRESIAGSGKRKGGSTTKKKE
ncbi:MAG: flotillin-like protein FloA [Cyclobacteriaceae bacterium]|tara:strand:- start:11092 stop:12123 length:1032 start_codon:yes stop_codon:yes gene_type:complete